MSLASILQIFSDEHPVSLLSSDQGQAPASVDVDLSQLHVSDEHPVSSDQGQAPAGMDDDMSQLHAL